MCRANQVVIVPESQETIASSAEPLAELPGDDLRLHRLLAARRLLVHQLAPFLHALLRLLEERAVRPCARAAAAAPEACAGCRRPGRPRRDSAGRSAPDRDRSARRGPRRASGRTRCRGTTCRPSSSASHSSSASCDGLVPSSPMPPVVYGRIVGHGRLAEQRLDDGRAEPLGDVEELVGGGQGALSGEKNAASSPAFRISAARARSEGGGTRARLAARSSTLCLGTLRSDLRSESCSWMSTGKLMCATPL